MLVRSHHRALACAALLLGALVLAPPLAGHAQVKGKPVVVVNSPAEPVPVVVDGPAVEAVHGVLPYVVPAGRQLVIEFVSASVSATAACTFVTLSVFTTLAGSNDGMLLSHPMSAPQLAGTAGTDKVLALGEATRLYADPGTTVSAGFSNNFGCVLASFVSFSGQLVDVR